MSIDIFIDSSIRKWVLIPIALITFLVEYIRHYVAILLAKEKKPTLQQVQDSQVIIRARLLRENGNLLPQESYRMRWQYLADPNTGYFKIMVREKQGHNVATLVNDLTLNNLVNYLPMILFGGWINWMFSGFVTTCIPFPLTLRFKPMLQRGLEVSALGASWVSSVSWYFVNVFGLRSIYNLVLANTSLPDPVYRAAHAIVTHANTLTHDTRAAFKAEFEAMHIVMYRNTLHRTLLELSQKARESYGNKTIIEDVLKIENNCDVADEDDSYDDSDSDDHFEEHNFERYFDDTTDMEDSYYVDSD